MDLQTRASLNSEICRHDFVSECGYIMLHDKLDLWKEKKRVLGLEIQSIMKEGKSGWEPQEET